ncbi:MAG: hypothetical protein ABIU54_05235 [Candidatus Eisenbacteria bacterium]
MRLRALPLLVMLLATAQSARALTARDLSSRMRVDGFTTDFTDDEKMFGYNAAANAPEEATDDSRWGVNNDLSQIRVSWDAQYLYIAAEGRIWDNNMVLLFDTVPGRGLTSMTALNSWKRNFDFDTTGSGTGNGFSPDFFAATWDGNTSPRLIVQLAGNQVDDERVGPYFSAAATFLQGNTDRAMELRIPWKSVFVGQAGVGTRDTVMTVAGVTDTFRLFPRGTTIKLSGVVTGGGDGSGGPDSAPDNLRGHTDNTGDLVFIDNYALIDLDRNDDTGAGGGGPDGVADWGVSPKSRITFRHQPPVVALRFAVNEVTVDRPAFAPDRGEKIHFSVDLDKRLDANDPVNQVRTLNLTANIFDLRGHFIRNLYLSQTRSALSPADPALDMWDGRNERGEIVPPGIYVIRTVIEPSLSRALKSVVVVR